MVRVHVCKCDWNSSLFLSPAPGSHSSDRSREILDYALTTADQNSIYMYMCIHLYVHVRVCVCVCVCVRESVRDLGIQYTTDRIMWCHVYAMQSPLI